MARSEPYRAYEIVVVPFPYVDRLAEKRRPALVISSAALGVHGLLWVAMITSASNEPWSCDVRIDDLESAGLPAPSVVRPAKIAAIDPARVLRRAGALTGSSARQVAEHMRRFVAAGPPSRRA